MDAATKALGLTLRRWLGATQASELMLRHGAP
jgi:hypothetical protein